MTFTARVADPDGSVGGVHIGYRFFIRASAMVLFERTEYPAGTIAARAMAAVAGGEAEQGRVIFFQDVLSPDAIPAGVALTDVVAEAFVYDKEGQPIETAQTMLRVPFFDTEWQPILQLVSPEPDETLVEGWQRFIVAVEQRRAAGARYELVFCHSDADLLAAALPADCLAHEVETRGRYEALIEVPHHIYWWGVRALNRDGRLLGVSTAWPVRVLIRGAAGRPPLVPTPTPAPDVALTSVALSFPWQIMPNRTIYYIPMDAPGEVAMSMAWQGTQRDLVVTLDAPGHPAPFAQHEGPSPLQMRYTATKEDLASTPRLWRLTIASPGGGAADAGALALIYPGGRLAGMFNLSPMVGAVVVVLPVAGPGRIAATVSWDGAPTWMALILSGPKQVLPYTRVDGPSPLSVNFTVEPFDHVQGEAWSLSVVAFSQPEAGGALTAIYPGEQ